MGNCIRHETTMHWGGDDWGTMFSRDECDDDEDDVVVKGSSIRRRKGKWSKTEVKKIRMSKKQLEELLRKMDVKDKVSVRQVISQLVRMSDHQQRSWRPALNSIPEI